MGDAQRAIRTLRAHAAEWRLDPARIGIMGFSAGGHLAMTASTHVAEGNAGAADIVDRASSRPDVTVLGYPVISMTEALAVEVKERGVRVNCVSPGAVDTAMWAEASGGAPASMTALVMSRSRASASGASTLR